MAPANSSGQIRGFAWLFFLLPLLELYVFFVVARHIGFGVSVILIVLSCFAGGQVVQKSREHLAKALAQSMGPDELSALMTQFLIGVLLLVPGFVSTLVGLLIFLPPIRAWFIAKVMPRSSWMTMGGVDPTQPNSRTANQRDVIEGECWHEDKEQKK